MSALLVACCAALIGCSDDTPATPGPSGGSGGSGGAGGGGGSTVDCPPGQAPSFSNECVPVGIQDCADIFIEDDGLCHPRLDKCPGGTIPKFDEGCVPVGIQGCAEEFIEDDGHCRPSMDKCPDGTYALPLEGCVPIDGPDGCGSGTWGNIADGPDTVWVDGAHVGTESGTQADPFTTIGQAVAAVPDGGRAAVAAGTYDELLSLERPVHLIGRCPSMVALTTTDQGIALEVLNTDGVRIEGLTLQGTNGRMMFDEAGVELATVHLRDFGATALLAREPSTEVVLDHVLVDQPQVAFISSTALRAQRGAQVAMNACAFVDNRRSSIEIEGAGTDLVVTGSMIQGTFPDNEGEAHAVHVLDEAVAQLQSTALVDNAGVGLAVWHEGTIAQAHECLLARGGPHLVEPMQMEGGQAAMVVDGATLELTSLVVEDHTHTAVSATISDAPDASPPELTVAASLIQRTEPDNGIVGVALGVTGGAQATVTDTVAFQSRYAGFAALQGDTRLQLNGSLVESVAPQDDGEYGVGILADGAELEMRRCAIADVRVAGIVIGRRPGHPQPTGLLSEIMIETVPAGVFSTVDTNDQVVETHHDVGDGIVTTESANTELSRVFVRDVIRAAVLYHESLGSMTHVVGHADQFGLVLQGAAQPTWEAEQVGFTGDDRDVVTDGHLAVPTAPP